MKQLFPLAWSGLKSRKRSTALLLSSIILSVAFLTVMGLLGSSSLYTVDLQNRDLYGEQKLVAWNLTDGQKTYFQNSSVWDEIGKMTIYGAVASVSDTALGIGTMDEQAIRLGHIRLSEGRWPQAPDEVALEKSAYRHTGSQPYAVGDTIALEITAAGPETPQLLTFQVVGLLENYSAVWRSAYAKQTQEGVAFPATVSFLIAEPGEGFLKEAAETWLLNSPSNSWSVLRGGLPEKAAVSFNYPVYPQIGYYGGMSEEALVTVRLGALISGMVLICMMAILLNGFLLSVDRRRRQLSLLRCIGATKKQACAWLFCEAFLLLGMGIPSGLLLGLLTSLGAVKVFSGWKETTLLYHFDGWVLVAAVLVCVLCVCLATLLPALRAAKAASVDGTKAVCFRRRAKDAPKSGAMLKPFGLMLLSMRKSIGRTVLTTATFALVIVVFHVTIMTDIAEYQSSGTYEKADASLAVLELYDRREDGFLWQDSEKAKAIPVSVFSDVRDSLDVACQNAAVIPMFYCSIPFSRYDSYLNGHFRFDYKMLGLQNWERWGQYHYFFEKQTRYGYTEQEYLTEPRITVFDDALLEQFRPYVTDGAVDIEAIRRGEEIVLCMPDYYLSVQEEENGLQAREWISNEKPELPEDADIRLLTNTGWRAGDTLTFTWIERQENAYIRHERTVKIGAVVKGAPQVENSSGGVFCMAAGQDTLESLNVPYEISKVYVYFAEDADIPAAEACLEEITSRLYPLTRLSTRTEEALAVRQQRRTRLTVSGMLTVCLLVLGLLGLVNTVCSRIHSRRHEIGLLRCIGMTKGQIYRMFVYEGIVFGLLASLLGTAVSLRLLPKYRENWLHTQMPFYLILSCAACVLLSVLTVFLPARAILRKNPTEIVRIDE